jgi:hypothetical protein
MAKSQQLAGKNIGFRVGLRPSPGGTRRIRLKSFAHPLRKEHVATKQGFRLCAGSAADRNYLSALAFNRAIASPDRDTDSMKIVVHPPKPSPPIISNDEGFSIRRSDETAKLVADDIPRKIEFHSARCMDRKQELRSPQPLKQSRFDN